MYVPEFEIILDFIDDWLDLHNVTEKENQPGWAEERKRNE